MTETTRASQGASVACCPATPDKLTADEHLLIARLCDRYDFLFYCAQELHHSKPVAVAPEDERARLQREFVESTTADHLGLK